ncbi:MAG TPA: HAD family hydrolase [Burkholderiaceae bacterium]
MTHDIVFLLDVDNTLIDNDRILADLRMHLEAAFGPAGARRYWAIFGALRDELGYVDYLGALQRYRVELEMDMTRTDEQRLLEMSGYMLGYPFADRLYPRALDVVAHLGRHGPTVILTDGDVVFQPHKLQCSGIWDAVEGRVLICVHKEEMLDAVHRHYPAQHYVMVDDKLRVLAAMKAIWHGRLTTVFARQGHYALDAENVISLPEADLTISRIGELADLDPLRLIPALTPEKAHAD